MAALDGLGLCYVSYVEDLWQYLTPREQRRAERITDLRQQALVVAARLNKRRSLVERQKHLVPVWKGFDGIELPTGEILY